MSASVIIKGRTFRIPADNIDTDQIYPARYLTTTVSSGLGEFCFRDWRDNPASPYHGLFASFDAGRHTVLVAGGNFGGGSSREHAVWALMDMGFRAVISTRFGDIFRNNALKNGLVPVQVEPELADFLLCGTEQVVTIDLSSSTITVPGFGSRAFDIDRFAAQCIIRGMDSLDFLLSQEERISEFEKSRGPGMRA